MYRRTKAQRCKSTDYTHINDMRRFAKQTVMRMMEKPPAEEKPPAKTEAELIVTVANIQEAERALLFAERALKAGMPSLAAACEERAKILAPIKPARAKKPKPSVDVTEAVIARAGSGQHDADGEIAAS